MPKRKVGWTPALTHLEKLGIGRVRIPGKKDIYFGPVGVWPASMKNPPPEVAEPYRQVIAEWLARGGEQSPPPIEADDSPTIKKIIAAYLLHVQKTYRKRGKPTKVLSHTVRSTHFLVELFAEMPAAEFGPRQWRKVRDAMLNSGILAGETINLYGTRLKAMFNWAAHEGWIPEEVADAIHATRWFGRGVKAPMKWKPKQPVPDADFSAVLPNLSKPVQAILQVQKLTGMRPEEACWMRASDITDTKDGLWIYEARDDANKLAHRKIPKVVRLGPRAQKILRPFLKVARQKGPDTWLFTNRIGRPISPECLRQRVADACQKAGVPPWTPSRLRHTRGSATEKRYGKEGSQAELGHLNSEMTGRYTRSARDELLDELARKIAKETG